ncbi:outer membrane protein assembly factor BamB family protein [Sphingomonas morindae]|uniref:PQQ-binding-like beta-propeller repeat protein n=1 Tax=Sphingomonas morindae TaxID=1541170 RepID=A0ABY4X788_9SPHN|nr:PQQ-binding-like beta-propeller repeat protein [Sphingomonas morindae]USI72794.1 PQQ-binding-like beta-propeller repeat protein [Sphingomonas morindae]
MAESDFLEAGGGAAPAPGEELAGLRDWIRTHCLISGKDEPLRDSRGRPQGWAFDLRIALLEPWIAVRIAEHFWDATADLGAFQPAAVELAGVSLLGAILAVGRARGREVGGLIVRRERKTHGRARAIEGRVAGLPVVLIDDMLNSGGTLLRAAVTLQEEGVALAGLFTVLDFGSPLGRAQVEALGFRATSMFRLEEFGLDIAVPDRTPPAAAPLAVRWRFMPGERRFTHVARKSAPVVAGDLVLHASEDGWLHAIETGNGAIRWGVELSRHSRKGIWSTPLVADGHVFVGSYDGALLKLRLADGATVWRFDGAEWIGSSPCLDAAAGAIYIGLEWGHEGGRGAIARIDAATGALVWACEVPATVHASPALLAGGDIVCGANDGLVRRIGADGALRWAAAADGEIKGGVAIAEDGGTLFVAAGDGVTALAAESGARRWRLPLRGFAFGAPVPRDGHLAITATDGMVRVVTQAEGRLVAERSLRGKIFASPVFVAGDLVIGAANGRLARLSWPMLAPIETHQFAERIVSEIGADATTLFVPTYDGQLFAVERR